MLSRPEGAPTSPEGRTRSAKCLGGLAAAWFVITNLLVAIDVAKKWVADETTNHELYQLSFAYGFGLVLVVSWRPLRKWLRQQGWAGALLVYVVIATVEIAAGLFAGSWTPETRGGLVVGFGHGLIGTGAWAVGVVLAMRLFRYSLPELCFFSGLAGFLVEGVFYQGLYLEVSPPLFFLLLPPVVGWHYILLAWYPAATGWAATFMAQRSVSRLRWLVILGLPCVLPALLSVVF